MSEKFFFIGGLILLFFFALSPCPLHAQEDVTQVADTAFETPMRPSVAFYHDAHNEKAGIDDCSICHHAYADGEKQEDDDSVGMECSECHFKKDGNNPLNLIQAYHGQCTGCHAYRKAGPVMCGECHKRE
ncbi:MAG: cytochrome c3 family protein [Desulfosalsimonadaceae bacterium]|nr:cytochrome c3 family protein [Desulfosalsimonadaceae bacterium]